VDLLRFGADLDLKNKKGKTPRACRHENIVAR
jgi:hypothetical protein